MLDSRDRILASIRNSLASARHLPSAPSVTLSPSRITPAGHSSLAEQFASELQKLSGLFMAERAEKVPGLVARLLHEHEATELLAWDSEHLPVPGLLDELRREGFKIVDAAIPHTEPERTHRLVEIERIRVGLTGVDAALADTGTLALRSGLGRPRLASLSVRTHIALFTPEQLYPSWAAWWAGDGMKSRLTNWVSEASNLTLISGPSRTADIEMTLTVGVHGPAEVIAVLCSA
jgi:L-lactate dehydrogenase complex protein LldG